MPLLHHAHCLLCPPPVFVLLCYTNCSHQCPCALAPPRLCVLHCPVCAVYFIGLLILLSKPSSLEHGSGLPGWNVGALIVMLGTGRCKSNVSLLIVDQYCKTWMLIKMLLSGKHVIVDLNVTITRIYNLFYWCINVSSLPSLTTTKLEHKVGFWAMFMLPTLSVSHLVCLYSLH